MHFHIYNQSSNTWIPAEGEIVDVAPHLPGETFAAHICPLTTREQVWKVSHIETGCLASSVYSGLDREDAIESARARLAKVDQDAWAKVLEKTRRMQSGAPARPEPVEPEPINEVR